VQAASEIRPKRMGLRGGDAPPHRAFATLQEGTHHNHYGSYEIAKCAVTGIEQAGLDLGKYIVEDFADFDPSNPDTMEDFKLPNSPSVTKTAPLED